MTGPRRASRSPRSSSATGEGSVRPRGTAKDRALRLLAVRDRSRRELERRLRMAGFEPDGIGVALDALAGAGLIDDGRFAEAVVQKATTAKPSGRRAVLSSLLSKGVDRATAELAVERMGETEEPRAEALAARQARRLADLPPEAAYRRLYGLLLRRGFDPGISAEAARRALGRAAEET